jgi:hypothetical protein
LKRERCGLCNITYHKSVRGLVYSSLAPKVFLPRLEIVERGYSAQPPLVEPEDEQQTSNIARVAPAL